MDATSTQEYCTQLEEAVAHVRGVLGPADIALVLGSGLNSFSDHLENQKVLLYSEIPHMPQPSVSGHSGKLVHGTIGDKTVLCLAGRTHSYEGLHMHQLVFATLLMAKLDCKLFLATNAAGGAQKGMFPGCLFVIRDHLNAFKRNPLAGLAEHGRLFPPSVDCSAIYSKRLRDLAFDVADEMEFKMFEGCYACEPGPTYETHAEVVGGGKVNVDAFGMSTIWETTAAAALGLEVFAMSLCTNLAAGMVDSELTHDEVKEVAAQAGPRFTEFMKKLVQKVTLDGEATKPLDAAVTDSPLPIPQAVPPTEAQIAAAAEFVKSKVQVKDNTRALYISNDLDECILADVSDSTSVSLASVPAFPVTTNCGRNAKLVFGTSATGANLCVISSVTEQGFSHNEATFVAQLLHRVNVGVLFHTFTAGSLNTEHAPVDSAFVVGDVADWAWLHATPHTVRGVKQDQSNVAVVSDDKALAASVNRVSYVSFIGPTYPTPHEQTMCSSVGADVVGITPLSLATAAKSLDITVVGIASTSRVAPSFKPSPNAAETAKKTSVLLWNAVNNHFKGDLSPADKIAAQPIAAQELTVELTPPCQQGTLETVGAAAEALTKHANYSPCDHTIVAFSPAIFEAFKAKLTDAKEIKASDIVNMPCGVELVCGKAGSKSVLLMHQTKFANQGYSYYDSVVPIRIFGTAGVNNVLLVSPLSSISADLNAGSVVRIADHINLSGRNPLCGHNVDEWGARFPDMSALYGQESAVKRVNDAAASINLELQSAVVGWVTGPIYHSPTAGKLAAAMGCNTLATAVAPEAITARHHKRMNVLGLGAIVGESHSGTPAPLVAEDTEKLWTLTHALVSQ